MGLSEDLLVRLSDALERNTTVLDLVANHMIRGRPGATMPPMPSSTVQEDQDTDDETAPMKKTGKLTKRFRQRARPQNLKSADELLYRVSLLSKK
jgi:hypothetical protein